ncbi:hypothetical protein EVJ58_g5004 [Rhodofomes roseus]|uniref:BTB domain-containing protein n=1 Tax=Rhodofomes roseus TaxID=34475 RepID=A0A4Y9YEN1_9APHY|nr:hypothetical protein EVJ58_g5004 [Rhodofomes roseus]
MASELPDLPKIPPYALPPFDHPKADFIIRSSDLVDFRVSSFILEVASDVFATMLKVGNAEDEELRDGCPVVPVQEDSRILDSLLRIIYPQKAPALDDLPQVHAVLAAALKYDMTRAVEFASAALRSFIPTDPFRVWAIAVRNELEPEARAAADEIIRQHSPVLAVLTIFPSEMQHVTAGAYYRLLQYHRLKGKVEEGFGFCRPSLSQRPNTDPSSLSTSAESSYLISPSHSQIQDLADVVCRSSDGQEFPAHKALLALASPVMHAMITSIPTRDTTTTSEGSNAADGVAYIPALVFEEDGDTLRALLGLCYPLSKGDAERDVQGLLALLDVTTAAAKYDVANAVDGLRRQWSRLSASDPLRAYLLAVSHNLHVEARQAATQLLDRSMVDYYVAELEACFAPTYRSLLLYHWLCDRVVKQCGDAVIQQHCPASVSAGGTASKASVCRGKRSGPPNKKGYKKAYNYDSDSDSEEISETLTDKFTKALRPFETKPYTLLHHLETDGGVTEVQKICSSCVAPGDRTRLLDMYAALRKNLSEHIAKVR